METSISQDLHPVFYWKAEKIVKVLKKNLGTNHRRSYGRLSTGSQSKSRNTQHQTNLTIHRTIQRIRLSFVRRLAIRHGEFFYYNGENLVFGTKVQPIIKLGENIDLIDVEFEMRMQAQDFSFISYDAQSVAQK